MRSSERHQEAHAKRANTQTGRQRPYWMLHPRRVIAEEMRTGAIKAAADLKEQECPECTALTLLVSMLNAGGQSGLAMCSACTKRFQWQFAAGETVLSASR